MNIITKDKSDEIIEVLSYFKKSTAEKRTKDYLWFIEREIKGRLSYKNLEFYIKEKVDKKENFLFIGVPENIQYLVHNQETEILLPVTENAEKKIQELFDYFKEEVIPNIGLTETSNINYDYLGEKIKQIFRTISYLNKENFNAKIGISAKNENLKEKLFLVINMRYHPLSYTVENLYETMKSIYLCLKNDLEESINKKIIEAVVKENELGEFEITFLKIKDPSIRSFDFLNFERRIVDKNKKINYRAYLFEYSKDKRAEIENEKTKKDKINSRDEQLFKEY